MSVLFRFEEGDLLGLGFLEAQDYVQRAVQESFLDSREIIARYTAAFAVNFTDWLGKTYPWLVHERAQWAVKDNLRCEQAEDHVGMLEGFARQCGAMPNERHYEDVSGIISLIRRDLFSDISQAGVRGLTLCAMLEITSLIFIPDLRERAEMLGCEDFTYFDVHGEADFDHSKALLDALRAEEKDNSRSFFSFAGPSLSLGARLVQVIYGVEADAVIRF